MWQVRKKAGERGRRGDDAIGGRTPHRNGRRRRSIRQPGRPYRPEGRTSPAAARCHQPAGARQDVAPADRGRSRRYRLRGASKQNQALNNNERKALVSDVLDELLGLGPIEPLLKDPTITDILINGYSQVFVERYGVLEPTDVRFKDERHLLRIIQKIVSAVGRRIDESCADGRCAARRRQPRQRDHSAAGDRRRVHVDPQIRARADQHGAADRNRERSRPGRGSAQGDRQGAAERA